MTPWLTFPFPPHLARASSLSFRPACCRLRRRIFATCGSERRSAGRRERDEGETRHSRHRAPVRGRLLDRVRRPGRHGVGVGSGVQAMEPCAVDRGRDRRDRDGPAFSRRVAESERCCARSGSRSRNRRACGAPIRWASPSLSAGRPASARSWPPFSPSPAVGTPSRSGAALLAVYSLGLGAAVHPRRRGDRPVHARLAPSAQPVRPDREGRRRPAGRDRRRCS